jgi:hypothetical protein
MFRLHGVLVLALALLLGACSNVEADPHIFDETDYFALDGSVRAWTFASAEGGLDWNLAIEKTGAVAQDDYEIVTLTYGDADSGEDLWEVRWSDDPIRGVRVFGYTDLSSGVETTFSIPVTLIQRTPQKDPVVTRTDAGSFTASAATYDGCETFWDPSWADEQCLVIQLDGDGSGEHAILTGEYRLVPSVGLARLDLDAWPEAWWLSDFDWVE